MPTSVADTRARLNLFVSVVARDCEFGVMAALCDNSQMRFLLALLLTASLCRAGSVEDLARAAQLIVRGKVESKSIQRDAAGRIFTETKIAVGEVWKGNPKEPLLTVVSGSGILGQTKVTSVGQVSYEPGEEVIAFLIWNDRHEAVTVEMARGKFQVTEGQADNGATKLALDEMKQRIKETLR
jgi:hypothetical protein